FDAPAWSARTDFVFFWANVFTWTGQGKPRFASYPLSQFDGPWSRVEPPPVHPVPPAGQWPGIYRTAEGMLRAFHAPAARYDRPQETTPDWRQRLEVGMGPSVSKGQGYDMSSIILIVAIGCLIGASLTWKTRARSARV